MEKCRYKSLEELPAIMCADDVKDVLGISISSAYELMKEKDFPSFKIGRRVVIYKENSLSGLRKNSKRNESVSVTDKGKLKSCYEYKPPLRFIKNKFFGAECEDLYKDKIQILCLEYALQLLWVAEVVWIENVRLSRSGVQDLIIDELTTQDLIKVVQRYKLMYKNPWEQALVILVVLINRLWFPDREENKYEVMRIKNASSISFAGKHYQAYCNKKLKDNFDTYAQGNFFPLPKAVFNFDLCAEEIALYAYLMHIEDRRTFTCIANILLSARL